MNAFNGVMLEIAQEFFGYKKSQDPETIIVTPNQKKVFLELLNKLKTDLSKFKATSQQLIQHFAADVDNYDKYNISYNDKKRTELLSEAKTNLQEFIKFKKYLHTWCEQEEATLSPLLKKLQNTSVESHTNVGSTSVQMLIDMYNEVLVDICQEITSNIFIDWDDHYYSFWNEYEMKDNVLDALQSLPAWKLNAETYKNGKDHPMYYMAELIRAYCNESALTEGDKLLNLSDSKDKDHKIVVMQVIQKALSAYGYNASQNELM